jgi:hypothetical protein
VEQTTERQIARMKEKSHRTLNGFPSGRKPDLQCACIFYYNTLLHQGRIQDFLQGGVQLQAPIQKFGLVWGSDNVLTEGSAWGPPQEFLKI